MKDYDQFAAEWLGHKVDYDHVYQYQCVDLILEYIYECFGIATGVSGNAIDYWNRPSAALLAHFTKIQTTDVQKGDIVVINPTPTNVDGHIGVASGNVNGTDVEILEQNGGAGNGDGVGTDAIRTRYIAKVTIAGILRPTVQTAPYTLVQITTKEVTINKETSRYGINHDTFDAIADDILAPAHIGDKFYTSSRADFTFSSGQQESYYIEDGNPFSVPNGFNIKDCDVYVAPTPNVPNGPLPINYATTPVALIVKVPGYITSATNALNHTGTPVMLDQGNYLQFQIGMNGMLLIAKDTASIKYWINPADNVKPVVAAPNVVPSPPVETESQVRVSFKPFFPDGSPITAKVLQTFLLTDRLSRGDNITVNRVDRTGKPNIIHAYGVFQQNGKPWALLRVKDDPNAKYSGAQSYYFYGVPITAITPHVDLRPYLQETESLRDYLKYKVETVYDKRIGPIIDGVFRPRKINK